MPRKRPKLPYTGAFKKTLGETDVTRRLVIQIIFISLVNLILYLRIGLQTLLPTIGLTELYIFFMLFTSVFLRNSRFKNKPFVIFCLAPLVVNGVLLLNYVISFQPKTETYSIGFNYETVKGITKLSSKQQRSSLITLQNNAYSAYPGIRVFMEFDKMSYASAITYTFKTGIFGIRVMTEYQFL